jgi:hypothetical protein
MSAEGELKKRIKESTVNQIDGRRQSNQKDIFAILNEAAKEFPLKEIRMDSTAPEGKSATGWIEKSYYDKIPRISVGEWFKKWFDTKPT